MDTIIQKTQNMIRNILKLLIHKPSRESKENFCKRNPSQSEDDFMSHCFKSPSELERKVALAIRSAIANLGEVNNEFIRAEVCFEELDTLPFWYLCGDAGFNTGEFVEAIELELGCKFTDKQLQFATVKDPDMNVQMRIYEFIKEFYDWYDSLT